jgi:hypothetical protein
MAALVQKVVVPDSWQAAGGRGTLRTEPGVLHVEQSEAVHLRILSFCEKLRSARGKPLRSKFDPERFTLTTRQARAKEMLSRALTATFHEPAPLAEILSYLEETTQVDFLVDQPALAAAGQSAEMKATLKADRQPLAAALGELLQPLGLAYRVIDVQTIQVSTRKAVAARLELEFYKVGPLLAKGQTPAGLVQRIKAELPDAAWGEAGGPGVLFFDPPSECLIVLQSQPVQAALERWLADAAR